MRGTPYSDRLMADCQTTVIGSLPLFELHPLRFASPRLELLLRLGAGRDAIPVVKHWYELYIGPYGSLIRIVITARMS